MEGRGACLQPVSLGDGSSSLSTGGNISHYLYDNSIRRQQLPQLVGVGGGERRRQTISLTRMSTVDEVSFLQSNN